MQGKYGNQPPDIKSLESASDVELCQYAKAGVQAAKDVIFKRNEWIVESLVRRNLARSWQTEERVKEDEEELRQEGRLALMKAVYKYEPDRKASFSTFAYPRVRKAMQTYYKKKVSYVKEPQKHMISFVSYEKICEEQTEENDGIFGSEQIPSKSDTEQEALRNLLIRSVDKAMNDLRKQQEYDCLNLRFGFFPYDVHTPQEICEMMNWNIRTVHREEKSGKRHIREFLFKDPYAVGSKRSVKGNASAVPDAMEDSKTAALPPPVYYSDAHSRRWVEGSYSSPYLSWDC